MEENRFMGFGVSPISLRTCALRQAHFRQGQKLAKAEPRPGQQGSGAPAPKGELSGERDSFGTGEALDKASKAERPRLLKFEALRYHIGTLKTGRRKHPKSMDVYEQLL